MRKPSPARIPLGSPFFSFLTPFFAFFPHCNLRSGVFFFASLTWLEYATPKVTKYQRCNFIIQIHQFTIKIDKININLLFECVKIVEFNFNSHVFHVMYQETRFLNQDACFLNQEGRRQLLISFVSERD